MRKIAILTVLTLVIIFAADYARANDVNVYDVTLQNLQGSGTSTTVDVKFSVSQKNAFPAGLTDGNSAAYYDRVWIFVKYFNSTDWTANTAWKHATLVAGGTMSAYSGGAVGVGLAGNNASNASPYLGAFVKPGANQAVRWNIGAATDEGSSVNTAKTYKVRVFAIEMVLVPTGAFYVGDGSTTVVAGQLCDGGSNIPFQITQARQQNGITLGGTSVGNLANNNATGMGSADDFNNSTTQALPSTFPMGYNAFYAMKYELSQKQYTDFLNTLTRAQQGTRVTTNISTDAITNIYVMNGTSTVGYHNTIVCPASNNGTTSPITFSTTTPHRACNLISWADVCAYADWAGLRPMTELEFEKACRGGGVTPVANEYAWGSTDLTKAVTVSNDGTATEGVTETGDGLCCYQETNNGPGPFRCGFAAISSTTRKQTGASYYGVMELSGNLPERPVTIGNATGRAFTGLHGDGALDASGNANVTNWPGTDAVGAGFRGGDRYFGSNTLRVSDRVYVNAVAAARNYYSDNYGGRLVRTSP